MKRWVVGEEVGSSEKSVGKWRFWQLAK